MGCCGSSIKTDEDNISPYQENAKENFNLNEEKNSKHEKSLNEDKKLKEYININKQTNIEEKKEKESIDKAIIININNNKVKSEEEKNKNNPINLKEGRNK